MAKYLETPYQRYCGRSDATRSDYLKELSEDYGISLKTVKILAQMLGPDEDFDGLVSELEDLSFAL